jgi:hypothetical protein
VHFIEVDERFSFMEEISLSLDFYGMSVAKDTANSSWTNMHG